MLALSVMRGSLGKTPMITVAPATPSPLAGSNENDYYLSVPIGGGFMKSLLLGIPIALAAVAAQAADVPEYKLVIKDHKFQPVELKVPADTKIKLVVTNQDPTPSEFESNEFNREKIVLPNSTVTVFVGPLAKGRYKFFDDFHQDTGNGVLIVE
ncbi:hypothetical protein MBSD_n2818 [Mizugakiibacter sediminis]|uniref:EfeO-type cupredoxin-like domain-containing protein n=2 Tax=Mizugakiibacter sediminis TaxID=1475481 RepID=A0A0K8QS67_9GAMM|nr:hypothetical protein MBSD_n2818 [Mizugakiibacter sediminis]